MNDKMYKLLFLGSSTDSANLDLRDTFVVAMNLSDELKLKKSTQNVLLFSREGQSHDIWESVIEHCRIWLSNVSSPEFKINNLSMWEFVYDEFLETRGGIFDQIYHLKTILSCIEKTGPKVVEIKGSFEFDLGKILEVLSKKYQFEFLNKSIVVKHTKQQHRVIANKILFLERFVTGKLSLLFFRKKFDSNIILTHGFYARKISQTISDIYVDELHESFIKSGRKPLVISLNLPRIHKSVLRDVFDDFGNIMRGRYRPFSAYLPYGYLIKRKEISSEHKKLVRDFVEKSCTKFTIEGIEIFPLLANDITDFIAKRVQDALTNIETCRKYLQKESPVRILNSEGSNLFGKALTLACNENGIKIFAIQLGIISKELPANSSFFIPKNFNQNLVPTIFVWGEYYKNLLIGRGYPESKIFEGGFYRSWKKKVNHDIGIGEYVLYVASANTNVGTFILTIDEEITSIKEISKVIPSNTKIIVKLHPTLLPGPYKENLVESNIIIVDNNKYEIEDLVSGSQAVIGKCSTLLLQSILYGKNILWINFGSTIDFCGLISDSIITSMESFKDHLNNLHIGNADNLLRKELLSSTGETSREIIVKKFYGDI
ncbi:Putative sialyltransferase [Nitrosotalea devaniterrae]|uniref:Sialyltransferase n=1 Tax=Nitrosotalea devaniterrae TaxID=1078905 RepID=A0A128A0P4_9ARCH|nr:Putative sialyltransferase [Candidatus Nitrosotalea devanaterra]